MFVGSCSLVVVSCLEFVVCSLRCGVVRCALVVVCSLFAACCLLFVGCFALSVVWCLLCAALLY